MISPPKATPMQSPQPTIPPCHFSPEALREDLFGSQSALDAVLQTVSPWLTEMRERLLEAAAAQDIAKLARHAHILRGALMQLHADTAVALTRTLEATCKQADDVPDAPQVHAHLSALLTELESLHAEVDQLLSSQQR